MTVSVQARAFDVNAKQAILIDLETDQILFEKNADEKMPTSSMSKVMTVYMVFEALAEKRISLTDKFRVSQKAYEKGGSKMFLRHNDRVPVLDLLKGVIVQSGNDATICLSEGLYGSEKAFADYMTQRAHEMGMNNTNFVNASGWPNPDHYSTARDLSILAKHVITEYPQYYYLFSQKNFKYSGIKQGNRNPLLYRNMGADGIKTGHTEEGGYGLIASAKRNDRRLVAVLNGMVSKQARADESAKLIEWGFNFFKVYDLAKEGEALGKAKVFLGKEDEVNFAPEKNIKMSLSRLEHKKLKAFVEMDSEIKAPIFKGQKVADLKIEIDNQEKMSFPLFATRDVEEAGFFKRFKMSLINIFK
jgi:D-alanyl-D-alanine carboxypeptidase (penicillin-binding protein 5/6)